MKNSAITIGLMCLFVGLAAATCHADTFTNKKTGEVLKGRWVQDTVVEGEKVMFVRLRDGKSRFLAIDEWHREQPPPKVAQPKRKRRPKSQFSYFVIPIKGAIGWDCRAAQVKMRVQRAISASPTVVILDIDTPGGSIADAEKIVKLIVKSKDLRFVAFVRKALSAGVPITLACKEVYVADTATVGAAVPYKVDGRGRLVPLPLDIAEKMKSAWQATCRSAAEHGQHSPLISEAMIDLDFALTMRKADGRTVLERNGKGTVLKPRGKILTLTGREAVTCGLAKGLVANYEALGKQLNMKGWQPAGLDDDTADVAGEGALTPDSLQQTLLAKAASLGLDDDKALTLLQFQERSKQWDKWKARHVGRKVHWPVALVQASDEREEIQRRIAQCRHHILNVLPFERAPIRKKLRNLYEELKWCIIVEGRSVGGSGIPIRASVNAAARQRLMKADVGSSITLTGVICRIDVSEAYSITRITLARCQLQPADN